MMGRRFEEVPKTKGLERLTIGLLEAAQPPAAPVERLVVEFLRREGRTSLEKLVEHVTRELYSEEIRRGAWALDIGFFGSRLFARDVNRELKAGEGILWEIKSEKESV